MNAHITMFITRDQRHLVEVKVGDKFVSIVIAIRYELDDDFICAIGKLV